MKDYMEPEIQFPDDDLFDDPGVENDYMWDTEDPIQAEKKEKETIRVVLVEPGKLAREAEIGTDLSDLQAAVGGRFIETFYPFDELCVLVCDDEGKLNGSAPNRAIRGKNGKVEDIIFGSFFICDCSSEDFGSLNEEQVKHYKKMFDKPEHFYMMDGEIIASQYTPHAGRGER